MILVKFYVSSVKKLFSAKILPYYLHQLDKVQGAAHFNVSDLRAKELIKEMRNTLPGYLVPRGQRRSQQTSKNNHRLSSIILSAKQNIWHQIV